MAETNLAIGKTLAKTEPTSTDIAADLEEPIYLLLEAVFQVDLVSQNAVP